MKFQAIGAVLLLGAASVSAAFEGFSKVTTNSLQALAKRDLLSDILDDIEDAASCAACEALLVVLKTVAALGNDAFVDVIVEVCEALVIMPRG
jgi:sphingomyelin phosphodiesterase